MAAPTFASAAPGYYDLCLKMVINKDKLKSVDTIAMALIKYKNRYKSVEDSTGVPWWMIAVIHQMEGGQNWNTHLHNGDSLKGYTKQVPKGRPQVGHGPPFTWEESAIDAIKYDKLNQIKVWPPERVCYELEKYNGWGYRGKGINSPYLWSFTNNYTKGKYISDGKWDPKAVSKQAGGCAILKQMRVHDSSIILAEPYSKGAAL